MCCALIHHTYTSTPSIDTTPHHTRGLSKEFYQILLRKMFSREYGVRTYLHVSVST